MIVRPDVQLHWLSWGGALLLFLVFFVPLQRRAIRRWRATRASAPKTPKTPEPAGPCEVRRVSLAFGHGHRAALQILLKDLSRRHDLATARGMSDFANTVVRYMVAAIDTVRYGAWQSFRETPEGAESRVVVLEQDLARRFQTDIVRGDRVAEAPVMDPRPEDGEGLVVISLVIGAMTPLPALASAVDAESVKQVLEGSLPTRPDDLVAFHVVWSPAVETDRMSSLELEAIYPELLILDPAAALGRASCGYCAAVFARELPACPACGAPSHAAAVERN